MNALRYAPIVIMVATAACIAVGSACCALAGVLRLAERVAVAIAPLRPPRV